MVIVTPSTYGFDNRVMLEGLKRSNGASRGAAVVQVEFTEKELEELRRTGVSGIRFIGDHHPEGQYQEHQSRQEPD